MRNPIFRNASKDLGNHRSVSISSQAPSNRSYLIFSQSLGAVYWKTHVRRRFAVISLQDIYTKSSSRLEDLVTITELKLDHICDSSDQSLNSIQHGVQSTQKHVHTFGKDLERIEKGLQTANDNINVLQQTFQHTSPRILEQSQMPNGDTCRRLFDVPYPRNCWFTGRNSLLSDMQRCLLPQWPHCPSNKESDANIFVIHGLPGIGKSHTAIEFSYRHRDDFSHIFWISADSSEKLEHGYSNIARSLRLASVAAIEETDKLVHLARSWLQESHEGT